jgi:hypothetical protein
MPDPNLPPLCITNVGLHLSTLLANLTVSQAHIEAIRAKLPQLPAAVKSRLQATYGLPERDVDVLMAIDGGHDIPFDGEDEGIQTGAVAYFECVAAERDPKVVSNW